MINNGWIKLHRKLLDNEFLMKDGTAYRVFIYLLLRADVETGKQSFGRYQISNHLDINPNTIYSALKRLENTKMITQSGKNKYTEFSIVNWGKYQGASTQSIKNKTKTKQKQINTLQEVRIKNKELYITTRGLEKFKKLFPDADIQLEFEKAKDYLLMKNKHFTNYEAFFRNWIRNSRKFSSEKTTKITYEINEKKEYSETEIQLIKFLKDNVLAKNPEAYINKIKREYGEKYLPKLLDLEFNQWYPYLDYWTKSKV